MASHANNERSVLPAQCIGPSNDWFSALALSAIRLTPGDGLRVSTLAPCRRSQLAYLPGGRLRSRLAHNAGLRRVMAAHASTAKTPNSAQVANTVAQILRISAARLDAGLRHWRDRSDDLTDPRNSRRDRDGPCQPGNRRRPGQRGRGKSRREREQLTPARHLNGSMNGCGRSHGGLLDDFVVAPVHDA